MRLISGNIIPLIVSGFHTKLYTSGFHESEDMVNILTINIILVNIGIILDSYVIASTQSIISDYFIMSLPGIKLV